MHNTCTTSPKCLNTPSHHQHHPSIFQSIIYIIMQSNPVLYDTVHIPPPAKRKNKKRGSQKHNMKRGKKTLIHMYIIFPPPFSMPTTAKPSLYIPQSTTSIPLLIQKKSTYYIQYITVQHNRGEGGGSMCSISLPLLSTLRIIDNR